MKFKKGDRVICDGEQDDVDISGMVGTVVDTTWANGSHPLYGIEFDEYNSFFHDCNGLAEDHHGYNVFGRRISLYNETPPDLTMSIESLFDGV